MALVLYDTRQRRKVPFEPLVSGEVRMYTCGPTVYKDAHIGNFRTYLFEDLLRRTLKFLGYRVIQVMNLTDVDDKTIRAARTGGVSLSAVTEPVIRRFFEDLDALNIERAEFYPRATEHIPEMCEMIAALLEKGYAYRQDDSIYFSVAKFPEYGRLSGMKLEGLARGVRIDADEYDKADFRDFALWKAWSEEDGQVGWDAPWGRGRPGWHIECSAMSRKYLGDEFDIHTGGVDNIFPHHENEIAQSVAATGKRFARYWLHSQHLLVNGEKMSKSLGNIYTVRSFLDEGHSPRVLRFALLTTHYRQQLNFTQDALDAAAASLERLDTLAQAARYALEQSAGTVRDELAGEIEAARGRFREALEDDLGISGAMAALFDLVSTVHRLNRDQPLSREEGSALLAFWRDTDRVLGFLESGATELPRMVEELVRERVRWRQAGNYRRADEIRDELRTRGFKLEDAKDGTVVIWGKGRKVIK